MIKIESSNNNNGFGGGKKEKKEAERTLRFRKPFDLFIKSEDLQGNKTNCAIF